MDHVDPDTLEALNALLQDVRASVEVEVALSNGATERAERETLVEFGIEEVGFSCSLREYLETAEVFVTRHVNGVVLTIIGAEHYDERLHEFAIHQTASGQRAFQLSAVINDPILTRLLGGIYDAHARSALWSEHRANQFADSRALQFRTGTEVQTTTHESGDPTSTGPIPPSTSPALDTLDGRDAGWGHDERAEDDPRWAGNSNRLPSSSDASPIEDE